MQAASRTERSKREVGWARLGRDWQHHNEHAVAVRDVGKLAIHGSRQRDYPFVLAHVPLVEQLILETFQLAALPPPDDQRRRRCHLYADVRWLQARHR